MKGSYTAVQNGNGTWTVKDVPIFAEHTRKDINLKIDKPWLEKAVATAEKRLKQDGYKAPMHIGHHEGREKATRAGSVIPTRVGKMKYEGREVWAVYADFVDVPDEVYQQIKAGALPYRSVEILDIEQPEISSLALLADEVPFFRFGNLSVEREIKAEPVRMDREEIPALAYRAEGKTSATLFNMPDDGGAPAPMPSPLGEIMQNQQEKPMQSDVGMMAMMLKVLQAIAARLGVNVEMLGMMGGAMTPPAPAPGPAEMKAPGTPVTTTAAGTITKTEVDAMTVPNSAEYVALRGEVDALKARLSAQEKEEELKGKVKSALKELVAYNLAPDTEEKLFADAKKLGEGAIALYVEAVKKHGQKEPPKHFTGDFAGASDMFPAEVLGYSAAGPGAVEKAAGYWQTYKALGGRISHIKLGDFLKSQMDAANGVTLGQ